MVVSTIDSGPRRIAPSEPRDTRKGDFPMLSQFTTKLPLRFWSKIRVLENGCWEWTGTRFPGGYGNFRTGSLRDKTRRKVLAHRWAYEHLIGPIPVALQADHRCHNNSDCSGGLSCPHRRCVNPAHIEPATGSQNTSRGCNRQRQKTHCPQGHPYDESNTYLYHDGRHRRCRTCVSELNRRYYARLREK